MMYAGYCMIPYCRPKYLWNGLLDVVFQSENTILNLNLASIKCNNVTVLFRQNYRAKKQTKSFMYKKSGLINLSLAQCSCSATTLQHLTLFVLPIIPVSFNNMSPSSF